MGLDMYLCAVIPNRVSLTKRELCEGRGSVSENEPADFQQEESTVEVANWRNAYSVHKWFLENCRGGKLDLGAYEVLVSKEQLEDLLRTVKAVLNDRSQSMTLLPPHPAYYVRATDIDNIYFSELEDTATQLESVLAEQITQGYHHFLYQSDW